MNKSCAGAVCRPPLTAGLATGRELGYTECLLSRPVAAPPTIVAGAALNNRLTTL